MPLSADLLAKKLWDVLSPPNKDTGAPDPTPSAAIKAYAKGYVKMLQAAKVAHATPGTVTASAAPPGSPITGGAAEGGKIVVALATIMVGEAVKAGDPKAAPGIALEAAAIATYLMASAKVSFQANSITGNSTATSNNPGPLTGGAGQQGKISGLSGSSLSPLITAATGQTGPKQVAYYDELCNYTMQNAQVAYAANTVQGTCTNSGQLTLGTAAGGTIS